MFQREKDVEPTRHEILRRFADLDKVAKAEKYPDISEPVMIQPLNSKPAKKYVWTAVEACN